MKRTWMALALTLCLLLSGCGGGTASKSEASSAEQQTQTETEISAVVLDDVETAEPAEDSQAEPELDDMSPEELGQWAVDQMDAFDEASYAVDCDMEIAVTVDYGGESTSQKASIRSKEIDSETDGYLFYESMQVDGEVTENWYGNGYAYLSDSYGQYKSPMDEDAYDEMMNGEDTEDDLDMVDFGTLTAEKTDKGYTVTYGDPELDVWKAFSETFIGVDENTTCTAFTMNGTVEMDANGAIHEQKMEITGEFDLYGETMTQTISASQSIINYDDGVSIRLPEDDEDFVEISDISLPETILDGFSALLGQYGVSYQSETGIAVSDGTSSDEYVVDDTIHYIYGFDENLYMSWNTTQMLNGETVNQISDTFDSGEGTQVINGEENNYLSDDEMVLSGIQNFIAYYTDCLAYGSDYQLEQDGEKQKLTMKLDSEYVEAIVSDYLSSMDAGIDFEEASKIVTEGTMTFWLSPDGMLVSQRFEGTCTLSYTGAELTVTAYDQGDVLTINAGVLALASA